MSGFWTPEKVEQLLALADGARSARQIGDILGCGRNAVIGKFHRMQKAGTAAAKVRLPPRHVFSGHREAKSQPKAQSQPQNQPQNQPLPKSEIVAMPAKPEAVRNTVCTARPPQPAVLRTVADLLESASARAQPAARPMSFAEAIEKGSCLFFHGDAYSKDGPDMPVCGAPRLTNIRVVPPYCRVHLAMRYRPRVAA